MKTTFPLPRKTVRLMKIADGSQAIPLSEMVRLTRCGKIKVRLPAFKQFIAAAQAERLSTVKQQPPVQQ